MRDGVLRKTAAAEEAEVRRKFFHELRKLPTLRDTQSGHVQVNVRERSRDLAPASGYRRSYK